MYRFLQIIYFLQCDFFPTQEITEHFPLSAYNRNIANKLQDNEDVADVNMAVPVSGWSVLAKV